jgi:hypothetical protein
LENNDRGVEGQTILTLLNLSVVLPACEFRGLLHFNLYVAIVEENYLRMRIYYQTHLFPRDSDNPSIKL